MRRIRYLRTGISLVEVLLVVTLIGIVAAMALPNTNSGTNARLRSTAEVLSADIDLVRSLAVTYNSNYALTFDLANNEYVITHTGSDVTLDSLPDTAFRAPDDPFDEYHVRLDDDPRLGAAVEIDEVHSADNPLVVVGAIEFGPSGETTESFSTRIWLRAGSAATRRYLSITVDPISGLPEIGSIKIEK